MLGSLAKLPGVVWTYLFLAEVGNYMTIYHRTRYESLGMVSAERFRGTGFCRSTITPRLHRLGHRLGQLPGRVRGLVR